jgi:hypothetical protein
LGKLLRLNPPRIFGCAAALIGLLCSLPNAQAQEPPPQGVSRGENFSAKPPAQLFASDCTGSGCHKSPQGLARTQGFGSLAGFLREHYTNSRESAAALANYLSKLPSGPEPREARTPRGKPATGSTASGGPAWLENDSKPAPEGRTSRRNPRTGNKPDDEPATAAHHPAAEPAEAAAKPEAKPETKPESKPEPRSSARERRGRQPATAAVEPPSTPAPEPQAAPTPPPAPPAPPPAALPAPKQYDIFD